MITLFIDIIHVSHCLYTRRMISISILKEQHRIMQLLTLSKRIKHARPSILSTTSLPLAAFCANLCAHRRSTSSARLVASGTHRMLVSCRNSVYSSGRSGVEFRSSGARPGGCQVGSLRTDRATTQCVRGSVLAGAGSCTAPPRPHESPRRLAFRETTRMSRAAPSTYVRALDAEHRRRHTCSCVYEITMACSWDERRERQVEPSREAATGTGKRIEWRRLEGT
jgi:hypothetical protein